MHGFPTLKSLSSLLGDFFRDFWPGFLALDQNGDGTDGRDGRDGRTGGRTGRTDGRTDGTDGRDGRTEYSFTVLLGRRNTVLQYYLLFVFLVSKLYFRYYINYLVVST